MRSREAKRSTWSGHAAGRRARLSRRQRRACSRARRRRWSTLRERDTCGRSSRVTPLLFLEHCPELAALFIFLPRRGRMPHRRGCRAPCYAPAASRTPAAQGSRCDMSSPTSIAQVDLSPLPNKTYYDTAREWREEFVYFLLVDRFHDGKARIPVTGAGRSAGGGSAAQLGSPCG